MKENCQSGENDGAGLARTLGPLQLTLIGVGSVIGAGIFVMTGSAAATHAGPAVVLSFVLTLILGFEDIPVEGSKEKSSPTQTAAPAQTADARA